MKKVLAIVAAASIVAAGAPAFAADVDLSGEVRVRYEQRNNYTDLDDDASDSTKNTTQRTRLSATVNVDDKTTAKITLNDARLWGESTTTSDTPTIVLNEGYLNINNLVGPVSLKVGRQALAYGNQRLIGSLEWAEQSRRFDALKLSLATEVVDLDIVSAKTADNFVDADDDELNIIYATLKMIPANKLDLYGIQNVGGTGNDMDVITLGARVAGKAAGADWTAEYATQGGDASATKDKDASAYAVTGGYTFNVLAGLRIGGELFSGSGSDWNAAATDDDETFDNLYPTNHFHFGISDRTNAWGNNTGTAIKFMIKPISDLTVKAELWYMETTEDTGALGGIATAESNLQVKYSLTEKTGLYAYYAVTAEENDNTPAAAEDVATKLGIQLSAKF